MKGKRKDESGWRGGDGELYIRGGKERREMSKSREEEWILKGREMEGWEENRKEGRLRDG